MISFFVPGKPRSTQTGSVIRVGGRSIPTRRGASWSSYVALVAKQHAPEKLMTRPLSVLWEIVLPRPKGKAPYWAPVSPDYGNALKGVEDALNGILWVDDRQIVMVTVTKIYGPTPGLSLRVEEIF